MGIADWGLYPSNGTPYRYFFPYVVGYLTPISNGPPIVVYNASLGAAEHTLGMQLNTWLNFTVNGVPYVYWVQDVAIIDTSSAYNGTGPDYVSFEDNIWNFSSYCSPVYASSVSGNGTVTAIVAPPCANDAYYYDYANTNLAGNGAATTTIYLIIAAFVTPSGQPAVGFGYYDGYTSQYVFYDIPSFPFGPGAQIAGLEVDGSPDFLGTAHETEVVLGGPGGGSSTVDVASALSLHLVYYNGHNLEAPTNAFNYAYDTAETVRNVEDLSVWGPNGTMQALILNGSNPQYATPGLLYDRSQVGLLSLASTAANGTLVVNAASYPYSNGGAIVVLGPGTYPISVIENGAEKSLGSCTIDPGGTYAVRDTASGCTSGPSSSGYSVTFAESSLPSGTAWSVTLNGATEKATAPEAIVFTGMANGTYAYTVGSVAGFTSQPSSGSVTVYGINATQPVVFYASVTFTEHGLPSGTTWSVAFGAQATTEQAAAPGSIVFTGYAMGPYPFTVGAVTGYTASPSSGSIELGESPVTETVNFTGVGYPVAFTESGLPSGTSWSVALAGQTLAASTSSITFREANGTYSFSVGAVSGYAASPSSGSVTVSGAAVTETVTFTPTRSSGTYAVVFYAPGLAVGATWSVTLSGTTQTATANYTSFEVANGTYAWTVTAPSGYTAVPGGGTVEVEGGITPAPEVGAEVVVAFASGGSSGATYAVTFTASGLPGGVGWLSAFSAPQFEVVETGAAMTVALADGTYAWQVEALSSTYRVSTGSGSTTVNGAPVSQTFAFSSGVSSSSYSVTFTESGLPGGTSWTVTLNGATESSTTSTITFTEANGSYAYTVGSVSGYTASPSSGTVAVAGAGRTVSVTFSAVGTGSGSGGGGGSSGGFLGLPGADGYYLLGALVGIVVVGIAVVLIVRGRRPSQGSGTAGPPSGYAVGGGAGGYYYPPPSSPAPPPWGAPPPPPPPPPPPSPSPPPSPPPGVSPAGGPSPYGSAGVGASGGGAAYCAYCGSRYGSETARFCAVCGRPRR